MIINHKHDIWRSKFFHFVRQTEILLRSGFLWICLGINLPLCILAQQVETFRDWLFLQADFIWVNVIFASVPIFLIAAIWNVYFRRDRDFVWKGAFYLLPLLNLVVLFRIRNRFGITQRRFRYFFGSYVLLQLSALIGEVSLSWGIVYAILYPMVLITGFRAFRSPFAGVVARMRRFASDDTIDSPPILTGWCCWTVFRFRRCDINFFVDAFGALLSGLFLAYFMIEAISYLLVSD